MEIGKYTAVLKDGKEYSFKSVLPSEAKSMYDLRYKTAGETNFLTRYPDEFPKDCEKEKESLEKVLEADREFFLGAYDGDQLIGSTHIWPVCRHEKFGHRAEIGILLAKDYWSCGIGKRLICDALEYAKECGYSIVQLDTFTANERAIGLYKHLGFIEIGVLPRGGILRDGTVLDELKMYKEI